MVERCNGRKVGEAGVGVGIVRIKRRVVGLSGQGIAEAGKNKPLVPKKKDEEVFDFRIWC